LNPQKNLESLAHRVVAEAHVAHHVDLVSSLVKTALELGIEPSDRLDLKIADAALAEMAEAFRTFRPYRGKRKVTIFGSARTARHDQRYRQAQALAARMASSGWMVVTGAGPGIMAAGMEGAGPEHSLGVHIRLPFEPAPDFVANDPNLVTMRYFFTRKLMLVKESHAFVALPGGFGTLDEVFELLTLLQTGKQVPSPIVLLDVPGGGYWRACEDFLVHQVQEAGLADKADGVLYHVTDDIDVAVNELLTFYSNYHSCRFVGDLLVIRLEHAPDESELEVLNEKFADICEQGRIHRTHPLPPERAGKDCLEMERVAFRFDRRHYARLRELIDELNRLPRAPDPQGS